MSNSTIFSGSSRYGGDFRAVIDRSVAIASLPMTQMQQQKVRLGDQSSALTALSGKVASLGGAISSIGTALGLRSYSASISDEKVVKASVSTGIAEARYSINVAKLGAYSTAIRKNQADVTDIQFIQVIDPAKQNMVAGATGFSLTVNGVSVAEIGAVTSLNELVTKINAEAGGKVNAYIVNVAGAGSEPDYQIGFEGRELKAETIQLRALQVPKADATKVDVDLLAATAGHEAEYTLNGRSAVTKSTSRTIALAPGLNLDLLATGSAEVKVERKKDEVQDALNSFATAFNAVVDELNKHRGEGTGALAGNPLIRGIESTLRSFGTYSSSGAVDSLAVLGLEFTDKGKLALNSSIFDEATGAGLDKAVAFLGSPAAGFIKAATDLVDGLQKSGSGMLAGEIDIVNEAVSSQDARIQAEQERIDQLTLDLESRMAQADALIGMLEQQVSYFTGMFESMRIASRSY